MARRELEGFKSRCIRLERRKMSTIETMRMKLIMEPVDMPIIATWSRPEAAVDGIGLRVNIEFVTGGIQIYRSEEMCLVGRIC